MGCQVSWRPVYAYDMTEMEGRITLGFNKKKDQNYLEKVPVRNPEFSWKEDGQGIVTVDMVHKGIFDKLAQKLWVTPKVSHVKLDRFGSFVWKQMDGNRNIIDIGVLVREEFADQAEPLYERLAEFVKMLRDNRFVTLENRKNEMWDARVTGRFFVLGQRLKDIPGLPFCT